MRACFPCITLYRGEPYSHFQHLFEFHPIHISLNSKRTFSRPRNRKFSIPYIKLQVSEDGFNDGSERRKKGHTLISDLIISNRLLISSSLDIFDFIHVLKVFIGE